MINVPEIDKLTLKLGEKYNNSKFALCVVAAKRARQLIDITKTQGSDAVLNGNKPLTAAAYEIIDGKISVTNS